MPENYDNNSNNETFGEEEIPAPEVTMSPIFTGEEILEQKEKTQIKRTANAIGISFCILFGISFLISFITIIASVIMFGAKKEALSLIEEPAVSQVGQILFSIVVFTLPFIVTFKFARFRISELVSFKKTEKGLAVPLFFFGISLCAFANMGSSFLDSIFKGVGIDYSVREMAFPKGIFGFLLSLISTAIVPALVEEFALRGIVLGSLRKFGDSFALVASSICFGVMHANFEQMPFAVVVGLFLGFSVIKTGSLRVAMAVHFYNNFMYLIFNYLPQSVPAEIQNILFSFLLFISLGIGILFLRKEDSDFFTLEKGKDTLTETKKYKYFLLSGGIIVFLVINLIEAVSFIFI